MANLRLAALRHRLAISTYRLGDCVLLIFVLTACLSAVAEASHATTSSYPKLHHRSPFSGTAKLFSKQQKSASNDVFKTSRRSSFLIDVVMPDLRGGDNLRGVVSDMLLKSDDRTATVAAVAVDYGPFIEGAYDWCCNLGAPSALVAGAVIATLYENMHSGDLEVVVTDSWWVQLGKKMLLWSHRWNLCAKIFEFEYLTARISFLQGLMNWLAAIGLAHILPSPGDVTTPSEIMFNKFVACSMVTLILLLVSFLNGHITVYHNYWGMLRRWFYVISHGHLVHDWPPRPLSLLLVPSFLASLYWGYKALSQKEVPVVIAKEKKHHTRAK